MWRCVYACERVRVHARVRARSQQLLRVFVCIRARKRVCMCVCMRASVCLCVNVYSCSRVYVYLQPLEGDGCLQFCLDSSVIGMVGLCLMGHAAGSPPYSPHI